MRSTYLPRLLALLPLALTLPACQHPQTASSIARTERPTLPTPNPELLKAERLKPLGHPETGVMVQVDQGWLRASQDLLAAAIGAIERGNNRAAGNRLYLYCVKAVFATGVLPKDCPK